MLKSDPVHLTAMTRGPRLGLPGDEPRPPSHPTRQASTARTRISAERSELMEARKVRARRRARTCRTRGAIGFDRDRTRPRGGPLTQSELIAGMPVRHHPRMGPLAGGGTRSGAQPAPQVKPRTDMAIPPVGPGRPEGVPGLLGTPLWGGPGGRDPEGVHGAPTWDPPRTPPEGGPAGGARGGPGGVHFRGYLITLPVGTDVGARE